MQTKQERQHQVCVLGQSTWGGWEEQSLCIASCCASCRSFFSPAERERGSQSGRGLHHVARGSRSALPAALASPLAVLGTVPPLRPASHCLSPVSPDRRTVPSRKCAVGMPSPLPSGFVWQDQWHPAFCSMAAFPNVSQVNDCLSGKLLYFLGDSTVRQWIDHLTKRVRSTCSGQERPPHGPVCSPVCPLLSSGLPQKGFPAGVGACGGAHACASMQ